MINFEGHLQGKTAVWPKIVGSEADLKTLLEGVQIGASLLGVFFSFPDIPSRPTMNLENLEKEADAIAKNDAIVG